MICIIANACAGKIFYRLLWTALLMVVLPARMAYAVNECSMNAMFLPVNLEAITLGPSVPVGPVGEPKLVTGVISCSPLSAALNWYVLPHETNPSFIEMRGKRQLFNTNIEGVGISVTAVAGLNTTLESPLGQVGVFFRLATGKSIIASIVYEVQYYKLSERTGQGSVTAMTIFNSMGYMDITGGFGGSMPGLSLKVNGSIVNAYGCKVTNPSMTVRLNKANIQDLKIGSSPGTSFNIGVSCPDGLVVHMTLTDAVSPANRTDVLTRGPGSTSAGVGLKVLNVKGPVKFGPDSDVLGNINQWLVGPSNGLSTIPLSVEYVATGPLSAVKPGIVNSLMSFTLSYQ